MLSAEANESGVYFVDNHFVPYAGKLPVSKGYNTKRRHAERGRADTMVCDLKSRAVCFTSGAGGLTTTLPGAPTQLRTIHPSLNIDATNRALASTQNKIPALEKKTNRAEDELKTIPRNSPPTRSTPTPKPPCTARTAAPCKWCYACSPPTPNTGSPTKLNAYLQDPNEYRATTRNLLQPGGTITYMPHSITVRLDRPTTPKITRALTLRTGQLNTNPPHIPGDPRPNHLHHDQHPTVAATLPDV